MLSNMDSLWLKLEHCIINFILKLLSDIISHKLSHTWCCEKRIWRCWIFFKISPLYGTISWFLQITPVLHYFALLAYCYWDCLHFPHVFVTPQQSRWCHIVFYSIYEWMMLWYILRLCSTVAHLCHLVLQQHQLPIVVKCGCQDNVTYPLWHHNGCLLWHH